MRPIRAVLISISKITLLTVLMTLSYLYVSDKYYILGVKQETVVRRCSGHFTMDAVCDCYNYYGRQCLSSKRLVWDYAPDPDGADLPSAAPLDEIMLPDGAVPSEG